MTTGQLDISAFPLAYAAKFHPEFDITLMPGMVKNHKHALRVNNSPMMKEIKKIINDAGVIVLSDAWLAGGFVSKKKLHNESKFCKRTSIQSRRKSI